MIHISCCVFSHCPSWSAFHPSPLCPAPSGIQFGLADGGSGRWLECSAGGSRVAGGLRSAASLHQRLKMLLEHRPPTAVHSGPFCPSVLSIVTVLSLLASPWEWHILDFSKPFYVNVSAHTFGKSLYSVTPFKGAVHFLLAPWLMTQFKKLAILKNDMQDNLI